MSQNKPQSASDRYSPVGMLLRPVRRRLAVAVALSATGQALMLVPLAGIAEAAKLFAEGAPDVAGDIQGVFLVSLICLAIGMATVTVGELLAHLADNWLTVRLRRAVVERLSRVSLGWFTSNTSAMVRQSIQDDISTLHELTAHYYTTCGRCVVAIAVSAIYLFAIDWRLAILSMLPFPLFYVIFGAAKKAITQERISGYVEGQNRVGNAVVEFISGISVVKAFGSMGHAHDGYRRAVDDFEQAFMNFTGPLVLPLANTNSIIAPVTVLAGTLGFGVLFVHLGWIAAVDVLPFVLVAPGISAPIMLYGFLGHAVANATGAAQRLQGLLDTPVLDQPLPGKAARPEGTDICFEGVHYAYDGEHDVVQDLNFTLVPGTVTAIVGPSGAGKSTVARLLLRFFDPTRGRIILGGADIRQIAQEDLYRHVGFVLQEVRLIHASLHDNIALGRGSASRQAVEAAARAANIHDRIMALPRGYDTIIGEDARLSGGEEQRVAIARAILLDPPVLVLDEATASADAESEVALQESISRFAGGRTLLVIAHRLETIMHADRIIVLEGGRVVETGRHADLLGKNGCYARLWRASMSEEEVRP